jgi:hypothetical protein
VGVGAALDELDDHEDVVCSVPCSVL